MKPPLNDLSAEYVRSILRYDAKTGIFAWRKRVDVPAKWNVKHAGAEAGTIWCAPRSSQKYRLIRINGRRYRAHRLAWLIVTGEWPKAEIDHEDGDGLNNSFSNLRLATRAENCRNVRRSRANTSGFKGVSMHKDTGRWQAFVNSESRSIYLGLFDTAEEAHAAYCAAAKRLHGEFARVA